MTKKTEIVLSKDQLETKIYQLLGFAQKAGKVVSGDDSVFLALSQKRIGLLLVAEDLSQNTKEKFLQKLASSKKSTPKGAGKKNQGRDIPQYTFGTKSRLGVAIGKSPRGLIAIIDESFTQGLLRYLVVWAADDEEDFAK